MNKITARLTHFKATTVEQYGPLPLTWWVLEKSDDGGEDGRTFTKEEEDQFIRFMLDNPQNFPLDGKNSLLGNDEDAPSIELYDMTEINGDPSIFVLRQNASKYNGKRYRIMDIHLLPNHNYNLPFNVIGEFNP